MRPWQETAEVIGRTVGVPVAVGIAGLTAVSSAVGLVLTRTAFGRGLVDLDLTIARRLVEGRSPAVDRWTGASTVLADSLTVAVLWVGAMAVAGWRTRHWRLPLFLLAAIGGEKLTYLFTSLIVGRARPPVEPLGHVFSTKSFPSGHVGSAIALYGGLVLVAAAWPAARRPAMRLAVGGTVAVMIAVVVAFSRMYRGHHYLTDVVWGALLGAVWLALARRFVLSAAAPPGSPGWRRRC